MPVPKGRGAVTRATPCVASVREKDLPVCIRGGGHGLDQEEVWAPLQVPNLAVGLSERASSIASTPQQPHRP